MGGRAFLPLRVFPAGSGVVDVRGPYGARGGGVTGDTAAIQKAPDHYPKAPFLELVIETKDGVTRTLRHGQTPGRGGGSLIPLYVGYPGDAGRSSQR